VRATIAAEGAAATVALALQACADHDAPSHVTAINQVWIEAGCISCKLCQDIAPRVFLVADDQDCVVKADAAAHFASLREDIEQAARDCPVEVIKIGFRS
jgi:ferredoxin